MTARVIVITGPAGSGKTARVLARYRQALAEWEPGATLWLSPTWRAAAAVRDRLMDGGFPGFFSPALMTFGHFAEAVLRASPAPARALGGLMKRHLIRLLLDEHVEAGRVRHFLPIAQTGGFVDHLCGFISELKRLDIWPDRFRQACQRRGMTQKDAEVAALYEAYQEVLNEHQLYDAEGRFWRARTLLAEGQQQPFERLRLVVADGFTDFTAPQHEIFQILAGRVEELQITLPLDAESERADLFAKPRGTLAELRRRHRGVRQEQLDSEPSGWPGMDHLQRRLFLSARVSRPARDTSGIEILAASHPLGEIELIGARIKRLLTSGGETTARPPVRPGDVAVVFRSLGDVEGLVREVFGKLGIPFTLESGHTLEGCTALAALASLVRLDVEDWPFRQLLAVLASNYFRPDWPEWEKGLAAVAAERAVRRLQIPRGRAALLEQLRRQADRPTGKDNDQDGRADERTPMALPLLLRLKRAFDDLPERATLGQWADAWERLAQATGLARVMEEDEPLIEDPGGSGKDCLQTMLADRVAWSRLREVLVASDRVARLTGRKPRPLDRQQALAALLNTVRSTRVQQGVEESGRVRVLSAASVRTLRIRYLFFAGLAERSFPPPDRQNRLYSEAEYGRLIDEGLPLVARPERSREEMLLFYEVLTRASRRLTFSFPALDAAAQPLSPSPYMEEVEQACGVGKIQRTEVPDLSPIPRHDDPLSAGEYRVKAVWNALEGDVTGLAGLVGREPRPGLADSILSGLRMVEARQDRKRFGRAEGILEGPVARKEIATRYGPARTFTPTELEQYASCPYQFFAERVLRLVALEELDLTVDYLARGRLVHAALADFHERVNEACGGPASPATLDVEDYERLLGEVSGRLSKPMGGSPLEAALGEVDRRLWMQWARGYRQQHELYDRKWQGLDAPLLPTWFEVSFGHSAGRRSPLSTERPLELGAEDDGIRLAGRIDRIDAGVVAGRTVFNVIDYKTGSTARFSREAAAAGTALQLPLYVMAAEQVLLAGKDAVPWQAGYWLVQQKGFTTSRSLVMWGCRGGRLAPEATWEELRQRIAKTVGALAASIRQGRFPVHSADEHCTRFCPFRTICRIPQVRSLEKKWQLGPETV